MERMDAMNVTVKRVKLKPEKLEATKFEPYGQIVNAEKDGAEYGEDDAKLDLSRGIPRFYIMDLEDRKHLSFGNITHHARVTQCLGSIGGREWYLAVAPASMVEPGKIESQCRKVVQSSSGHYYMQPSPDDVRVFRVDGPRFLKLHVGTWHAGPFFKDDSMNFYNLELSDTNASSGIKQALHAASKSLMKTPSRHQIEYFNVGSPKQMEKDVSLAYYFPLVVDHTTHVFEHEDNIIFEIDD